MTEVKIITERMVYLANRLLKKSLVNFDHMSVYGDNRRFCNSCRCRTDVERNHGKNCIITRLRYMVRLLELGKPVTQHVKETIEFIYHKWYGNAYGILSRAAEREHPKCETCGEPLRTPHLDSCEMGMMREIKDTAIPPISLLRRKKVNQK